MSKERLVLGDGSLMIGARVVREDYCKHFARIDSTKRLLATLRAGEYAFPGCYPMYLIAADGEALHYDCVKNNLEQCVYSIRHRVDLDWRVVGTTINYEDDELYCAHCGGRIASAYGE